MLWLYLWGMLFVFKLLLQMYVVLSLWGLFLSYTLAMKLFACVSHLTDLRLGKTLQALGPHELR